MIGTFEDVMHNMEHGVYNFTKDGKCSKCGECCTNLLPMSEDEVRTIRRYIKKHNIKEQKHSYPAPLANPPAMDLTCPFLDESKESDKCVIYPVRPEICRSFICSDQNGARNNPKLMKGERFAVDVRETFFGCNKC